MASVCFGCSSNPLLLWAPRHPTPELPPKPEGSARLVELGRPDCEYDVIGTVFGTTLDELRLAAEAHGGDGVYDTACFNQDISHYYFSQIHGQCDGRVFVCTGPARPRADPPPAAPPVETRPGQGIMPQPGAGS
jgi:hypothetical protein